VYNLLGQEVRTLLSQTLGPGSYSVEWDGSDDNGSSVASGVYFYRLKYGSAIQSRKMVLIK
ncbi:MAG TPA: FlgD immunoglobulin-like domain containing protein, partial [candidate division Zixibacteria bacterium]|nr:FlgD immunoglobulin-like domain containing protein [candidate division Zixibacteria bacterium]